VATPASAHDVTHYVALDASVGYATTDFEDYTPALGFDVGAGGLITEHVMAGLRGAVLVGDDEQLWFSAPRWRCA